MTAPRVSGRGRVSHARSNGDPTVAVLGGGIGGLSAAHELVERGFDVSVYEANERFGGKARSIPIPTDDGSAPLHGEHGFRFFPGFYRHLVDTMRRIPYRDDPDGVAGNLVETETTMIASTIDPEQTPSIRHPRTVREWLDALRPVGTEYIPAAERLFFAERMLVLLTTCRARRERELESMSWWEFIEADTKSEAYQRYLGNSTQLLGALRPRIGSARSVGQISIQLMLGRFDPGFPPERVLAGPTSAVWIAPWVDYLREQGVTLYPDAPVQSIECDGRRISGVTVSVDGRDRTVTADYYVAALPVEVMAPLCSGALRRAAPSLAGLDRLQTAWMNGIQFFLTRDLPLVRGHQVYVESPWALTSVSQRQFWDAFDVTERSDGRVQGVLSVNISKWDVPGTVVEKPARDCSPEEIKTEVWAQLEAHLNRDVSRLEDDALHSWFLDPALVESADGLVNRSPLLINTVESLGSRPRAGTEVPNLVLAADYVRTETDLATMESANEAARRAVNAIVDRSGVSAEPCRVWSLDEPTVFDPLKRQDAIGFRLGLPHPGLLGTSIRRGMDDLFVHTFDRKTR